MVDMPAGTSINFNEQNITKWEILMDGPDQSVYAVCMKHMARGSCNYEGPKLTHTLCAGRAL